MVEKLNTIEGRLREDFGKGASRRIRREGHIPAVVYGGSESAVPVVVDPKGIAAILHSPTGHNTIFTLTVPGKSSARVMLRDWQADPVHGHLLHVDMVRVAAHTKIKFRVPIHVTGEPEGVKIQGGVFEFVLREVEVESLPDDVPSGITVDVSGLTIGKNLRVSDLSAPERVHILTDGMRVVAHVVTLKAEEEAPAAEGVEPAPAEPEVIRKGKAEAEEGVEAEAAPTEEKKEKKEKK